MSLPFETRFLIKFLAKIVDNSDKTKMTTNNMGICFGVSLLSSNGLMLNSNQQSGASGSSNPSDARNNPTGGKQIDMATATNVFEFLLINHVELFPTSEDMASSATSSSSSSYASTPTSSANYKQSFHQSSPSTSIGQYSTLSRGFKLASATASPSSSSLSDALNSSGGSSQTTTTSSSLAHQKPLNESSSGSATPANMAVPPAAAPSIFVLADAQSQALASAAAAVVNNRLSELREHSPPPLSTASAASSQLNPGSASKNFQGSFSYSSPQAATSAGGIMHVNRHIKKSSLDSRQIEAEMMPSSLGNGSASPSSSTSISNSNNGSLTRNFPSQSVTQAVSSFE